MCAPWYVFIIPSETTCASKHCFWILWNTYVHLQLRENTKYSRKYFESHPFENHPSRTRTQRVTKILRTTLIEVVERTCTSIPPAQRFLHCHNRIWTDSFLMVNISSKFDLVSNHCAIWRTLLVAEHDLVTDICSSISELKKSVLHVCTVSLLTHTVFLGAMMDCRIQYNYPSRRIPDAWSVFAFYDVPSVTTNGQIMIPLQ